MKASAYPFNASAGISQTESSLFNKPKAGLPRHSVPRNDSKTRALTNSVVAQPPRNDVMANEPLTLTLSRKGRGNSSPLKNLVPYYLNALVPSKKAAFTLAEVLITLGIIGVVAAMTLPALIQKNHKTVIETRLEKFYSVINQAIQRAEVDYEDKKYWSAVDTDEFFTKYLKPYLKYTKYENKRVGTSNDWRLVELPDGSAFLMDIYGVWDDDGNQTFKTNGGHFIFCPQAKHCKDGRDYDKWGRTQFVFGYWPAGEIMPKYFKDKGVMPYLNGWDGNEASLYTASGYGCNENANNFYCTAIIMHNGWKIPDNYPYKF